MGGADSLRLTITRNIVDVKTSKPSVRNGTLDTVFQTDQTAVFGLYDGKTLFTGLIGPGETVSVDWNGPSTSDEKSAAYNAIQRYYYHLNYQHPGQNTTPLDDRIATAATPDVLFDFADSLENAFLRDIDGLRQDPDKDAYIQLKGLIEANSLELRYDFASRLYHQSIENTLAHPALTARSRKVIAGLFMFDTTLASSGEYVTRIAEVLYSDHMSYMLEMGVDNGRLADKYRWIDSLVPGPLKIPVMTFSLRNDLFHPNQAEDVEKVVDRYFKAKDNQVYADYIRHRTGNLFRTGMAAPPFTLEDSAGNTVRLSDFAGKVVYLDFWFEECVPCHKLMKQIEPVKARFRSDKDVVFLTVSIDDRKTWIDALRKENIEGFHVYTAGLRDKHPIVSAYHINGYPYTALIDRHGNIFRVTPSEVPGELIGQIEEARQQ